MTTDSDTIKWLPHWLHFRYNAHCLAGLPFESVLKFRKVISDRCRYNAFWLLCCFSRSQDISSPFSKTGLSFLASWDCNVRFPVLSVDYSHKYSLPLPFALRFLLRGIILLQINETDMVLSLKSPISTQQDLKSTG